MCWNGLVFVDLAPARGSCLRGPLLGRPRCQGRWAFRWELDVTLAQTCRCWPLLESVVSPRACPPWMDGVPPFGGLSASSVLRRTASSDRAKGGGRLASQPTFSSGQCPSRVILAAVAPMYPNFGDHRSSLLLRMIAARPCWCCPLLARAILFPAVLRP